MNSPSITPWNQWRHVPPAHSPSPLAAIMQAVVLARTATRDPCRLLEARLRTRFAAQAVVLVGSGTQALQLALRAAVPPRGPLRVAVPAYSCFDVATAAEAAGAQLVLYDLDPTTLSPDADSLERACHDGAGVVVVAALHGVPVDMRLVEEIARRHGALVLEDAAQGHGATWRGRPVGSLAPLSVLSFGRGKGWSGGGGGALLVRTSHDTTVDVVPRPPGEGRTARALLSASLQEVLSHPFCFAVPSALPWLHLGETRYRRPVAVRRLSRGEASLLEVTARAADCEAAVRRAHAWILRNSLRDHFDRGVLGEIAPVEGSAGWLRLPIRVPGGVTTLGNPAAARRLGVRPGYPHLLSELPVVQSRLAPHASARFPGAAQLVRDLVTLPTHSRLTDEDLRAIVRLVAPYADTGLRLAMVS